MNTQRFDERKWEFQSAVTRLDEACRAPFDSIVRDSVIQRFEFCWELAWKTVSLWLNYQGINVQSPRETFREAHAVGLIEDGNLWSDMQKMRNLTVHTYNEELADEVYTFVKQTGLALFTELANKAKQWQMSA